MGCQPPVVRPARVGQHFRKNPAIASQVWEASGSRELFILLRSFTAMALRNAFVHVRGNRGHAQDATVPRRCACMHAHGVGPGVAQPCMRSRFASAHECSSAVLWANATRIASLGRRACHSSHGAATCARSLLTSDTGGYREPQNWWKGETREGAVRYTTGRQEENLKGPRAQRAGG